MPRKVTVPRDLNRVDASVYNGVVARTQLLSIRLLENKFDIKPEAIGVEPSEWRKVVNFELGEIVVTDNGRLYGVVSFEIVCRHGRKRVLHAAARYLASYQVDGACSQEDGETFIGRVGRIAVYPYFRSLFAILVAEAGLQMPPLPIVSIAPRSLKSAAQLVGQEPD